MILEIIFAWLNHAAAVTCTQTLNPGGNVASAVSSAVAGSTVCLNAGSYGSVTLDNIQKASDVVIQSTSGNVAIIDVTITRSSHLKFQNLTIQGLAVSNQSVNLTFSNNKFTGQTVINLTANAGANYGSANILIDSNSFDNISVCTDCYEGRLQIISSLPCGVTVSNNHFGGPGESDGINVGANSLVIGPGNVFDGIVQGNYPRHVDSIQLYGQTHTTITGNYFVNSDSLIMAPDGGDTEIITNNVFAGDNNYRPAIQFGSHTNDTFSHNTVLNIDARFTKINGTQNTTGQLAQDNIFVNSSISTGSGCTGCTFNHNMFDVNASGTNNVSGSPSFSGGAHPTTMAGYQLTSSSTGYRVATDGKDMGALFNATVTTPPLTAPKNLRIVSP